MINRSLPDDESIPFVVGPSIEFHVRGSFSIETDALYERAGSSTAGSTSVGVNFATYTAQWRGNVWEFPALGKYYLHTRTKWKPFVGAGVGARWLTREEEVASLASGSNLTQSANLKYSGSRVAGGLIAAGGIRFRTGRLAWLPEFRYSRWGGPGVLTRANEAGLLLGLRF